MDIFSPHAHLIVPTSEESAGDSSNLPDPTSDFSVDSLQITSTSLTPNYPYYRAYKRRWLVLLMFSFASFLQGYLFNMWGPIFNSLHLCFGFSQGQIALLPLLGDMLLTLFSIPSAFLLEKWGLRRLMQLMTGLTLSSTVIRCVPTENLGTTLLVNLSSVLNGLGGVATFFLPPYIASRWFPPSERRMATAIGELLNGIGISLAFLIGPAIVSEPGPNVTSQKIREQYYLYTYIQTSVACLLFFAVCIYYPERPPHPPSETAQRSRVQIFTGLRQLIVHKDFWYLSAVFSLVNGSMAAWLAVLSVDLDAQNVDQMHAGWIGFYSSLAGAVTGILTCRLAAQSENLKAIQLCLCTLAAEGAVWLLLIMRGYLHFTLSQAYFSAILLCSNAAALVPINFELAVEVLYPIDEAIVVAGLGVAGSAWASLFLVILLFPVGTVWMDWMLSICCILALSFALLVREKYNRTDIDEPVMNAD